MFFRVDVNFQTAIVTYRLFCHYDINQHQGHTYTSYKISDKTNMLSRSGENDDFISFAIFSNASHLEFSTQLNFIILKPWSLIMKGYETHYPNPNPCSKPTTRFS